MEDQIWIVALLLGGFALYVVAKVIGYMRKSERDWQEVDKSRLKEWEDDEEW